MHARADEGPANPFPHGAEVWAWPQAVSAADGRSSSSICVSPTPDSSEMGPHVLFPLMETMQIRPQLLTPYMLRTIGIVMPLSAKATCHCPSSSLNNVNYFSALRHGSSGMQKAVLCSHAIPLTASPLSLFCSFQYSCLQSSRKHIKRGFS